MSDTIDRYIEILYDIMNKYDMRCYITDIDYVCENLKSEVIEVNECLKYIHESICQKFIMHMVTLYRDKHKELRSSDLLEFIINRIHGYGCDRLPIEDTIAQDIYKVADIARDCIKGVTNNNE